MSRLGSTIRVALMPCMSDAVSLHDEAMMELLKRGMSCTILICNKHMAAADFCPLVSAHGRSQLPERRQMSASSMSVDAPDD